MATAEPSGTAVRASHPAPRPSGTGAAGPPTERSGIGVPWLGERTPAAVEKRGPYMVARAPSSQAKLRECGPMRGLCLGGLQRPGRAPERRWGDPGGAPTARSRTRKSVRRAGSCRLGGTAEWGTAR